MRPPRTADECDRHARTLLGDDFAPDPGVLHVAAVWQEGPERLRTIAIHPDAPPSPLDFFLLNLVRARADAIVTTGKILRDEPDVRHRLQGPDRVPEALAEWRRRHAGRTGPPVSVVLTSGRAVDPAHPLFEGPEPVLVYAPERAAPKLTATMAGTGAEVVGRSEPGLLDTLTHLRSSGHAVVAVEAGPSTASALYEALPAAVDELVLSVFLGGELPASARGGRFVGRDAIERALGPPRHGIERDEPSGRWRFLRYRRSSSRPSHTYSRSVP